MSSSLQHIIWLTPGFAADEQDDTCIPPLQLLAKEWSAIPSIQLHIVTMHYPRKTHVYSFAGTEVYPHYRQGILAKWRTRVAAYRTAKQLLKTYPNALLHSFWLTDAALLGQQISRRFKRPHLVTLMGQDARPSNRFLPYFSLVETHLICLSQKHREELQRQQSGVKAAIIPWGVPATETQQQSSAHRPIDLIGVGSLIPLKAYDIFLEVVALVQKAYPQLRVLLIGDGPMRSALGQQTKALNITQNVTFLGQLPRQEVLKHLATAKILLHTSTYESFGYVLVEALAQGTQVVSTPVGIAPELTEVFTAIQPQELAQSIMDVLEKKSINGSKPNIPYTMAATREHYHEHYRTVADISTPSAEQ